MKVTPVSIIVVVTLHMWAFSLDVGVGLKGGINLSTVIGDDIGRFSQNSDKTVVPGAIAGAGLRLLLTDYFCITPEVLYSMKGARFESEVLGVTTTVKLLTSYLEFPLNFAVIIPAGGQLLPRLYAGPVIGFNLTSKTETETDGTLFGINMDSHSTNAVDFGFDFGAGLDFDIEMGTVMLDFRYTLGVMTIYDNEDNPADIRNSTISFIAGWGFGIGK